MPTFVVMPLSLVAFLAFSSAAECTKTIYLYLLMVMFAACTYSIVHSGYYYSHYYSYMFVFITFGGAYFYSCLNSNCYKSVGQHLAVSVCVYASLTSHDKSLERFTGNYFKPINMSYASKEIIRIASSPNERLVVWGWYPILNVETRLPSATKENHSYYTSHSLLSDEFEKRYIRDMKKYQPYIFVDSKVPISEYVSFKSKKELFSYIKENYVYYKTLPGSSYYDFNLVDLYINRSRIKQ
jgi:hypothetical protein